MSCTYATMCTLCAGDVSTPFERDICEKLASGVLWLMSLTWHCGVSCVFVSTDPTTDMMCMKYIAGDKREGCYEISQGNPPGPNAHALYATVCRIVVFVFHMFHFKFALQPCSGVTGKHQ